MQRIKGYEPGGGSPEADEPLARVAKSFGGMIPNFHKVLANSPAAIDGFASLRAALQNTKLAPAEREIVALEVSRRNDCHYCNAAHTMAAGKMGVAGDEMAALLAGRPMSEARHALVQRAAQALIDAQGSLDDAARQDFNDQGLSDAELIEIIMIVGMFTSATMVNNLAQTEIDPFMKK